MEQRKEGPNTNTMPNDSRQTCTANVMRPASSKTHEPRSARCTRKVCDGQDLCWRHSGHGRCRQRVSPKPRTASSGRKKSRKSSRKPAKPKYAAKMTLAEAEAVLASVAQSGVSNKQVMLAAVAKDGDALELATAALRADKEVVLAAVAQNSDAMWHASADLLADKDVMLAAVARDPKWLRFASADLQSDKEMVLAAVANDGSRLFNASWQLRANKEVVLVAVMQDGEALQFAAEQLRADKEVVLAAVSQAGWVLQYAAEKLRADKEVVLAAVSQAGWVLQYAAEKLRADKEVVLAAVANDGYALELATAALRADKEVVLAAVANNGYALRFAASELQADKAVVRAASQLRADKAVVRAASQLPADEAVVRAAHAGPASPRPQPPTRQSPARVRPALPRPQPPTRQSPARVRPALPTRQSPARVRPALPTRQSPTRQSPARVRPPASPVPQPSTRLRTAPPMAQPLTKEQIQQEPEAVDVAVLRHLHHDVFEQYKFSKQLGETGKEGTTMLATHTPTGEKHAVKLFKPNKSVAMILKEVAMQREAAAAGISPAIMPTLPVDGSHRLFAMQVMGRTLLQILHDQGGVLSRDQYKGIEKAYGKLDEIGYYHNDGNVSRNIMEDGKGQMYLIDFGMSKPITASLIKRFGPKPNMQMLVRVDEIASVVFANSEGKQRLAGKAPPYFVQLISDYEKEHGVVVDLRRAMHAKVTLALEKFTKK